MRSSREKPGDKKHFRAHIIVSSFIRKQPRKNTPSNVSGALFVRLSTNNWSIVGVRGTSLKFVAVVYNRITACFRLKNVTLDYGGQ